MPNKVLNTTLYCYVERENAKYAKTEGKKLFGSFSAYVNALIAKDRGVTPRLGHWKADGEVEYNQEKQLSFEDIPKPTDFPEPKDIEAYE